MNKIPKKIRTFLRPAAHSKRRAGFIGSCKIRRPLCLIWMLLSAAIWLMKLAGVPIFGEPRLSSREDRTIREEKEMVLTGRISDRKETANSIQYVLKQARGEISGQQIILGNLLLSSPAENGKIPIGCSVSCRADPEWIRGAGNPGEFDPELYYNCQRIYIRAWTSQIFRRTGEENLLETLRTVRSGLAEKMDAVMGGREGGIAAAMILGERRLIETGVRDAFSAGGIAHILSISSLHISIIGMGLFVLLQHLRIPLKFSALFSSLFMLLYCLFVGSPISALRAILMFFILIGARIFRRSYDPLNALSLSCIVLLITGPEYLFLSGYQLSVGAVLGVTVIAPAVTAVSGKYGGKLRERQKEKSGSVRKPGGKRWKAAGTGPQNKKTVRKSSCFPKIRKKTKEGLKSGSILYLSVTAAIFPLLLWYYYELPVLGIVANVLLLPAMGVLLGLCAAGALLLIPFPFLAEIVLFPAKWILRLFLLVLEAVSAVPWNTIVLGQPSVLQAVLYYLILSAVLVRMKRDIRKEVGPVPSWREGYGSRGRRADPERKGKGIWKGYLAAFLNRPAILILAAVTVLLIRVPESFSMTMLDVGQGDCIAIRERGGGMFLVDGGSSSVKEPGKYRLIPYLKQQGIREIDGIFITHADADHTNALEELLKETGKGKRFRVKRVFFPAWMRESADGKDLRQLCGSKNIPAFYLEKGDRIEKKGIRFNVLHPFHGYGAREGNEGSMVLALYYSDRRGGEKTGVRESGEEISAGVNPGKGGMAGRNQKDTVFSALLTGDLEGAGEKEIIPFLKKYTVLKVAHHGSKNSTSEEFLRKTSPDLALISAPAKSLYGHPHAALLERLSEENIPVRITRDQGAIRITVSGGSASVLGYRSEGF